MVNLTKLHLGEIDLESESTTKIHNAEMSGSGWNVQRFIYLEIELYKICGIRGNSFIKLPMRSNVSLNIQNIDTYCFIWLILAKVFPTDDMLIRVTKDTHPFNKLNIANFDLTNGMHITDFPKFERSKKNLSVNIFELQNSTNEKNILAPLYTVKNNLNTTNIDLLLYKISYVLIRKLDALIYNIQEHKNFICRNCLSSHRSEVN